MRAFFLILLAIILILCDQRSVFFHQEIRPKLAVISVPLQMLVNAPIKTIHWLGTSVTTEKQLLEENARLRARELLLESRLQKLLMLERENTQLKQLLQSSSHVAGHVKVAELLAVDLDPSVQQVVLDKGLDDHVYVGQPVLDAYGVMGQVINVGPLTSKVLLITDPRAAVPVQDNRNGIREVAVGLGVSRSLALINVPDTTDIKVGDLFVASGLGLRFPVGYPVGVVSAIAHIPGRRFSTITLLPSAHLDQTEQVLLAWPNMKSFTQAVRKQFQSRLPGQFSGEKKT